MVGSRRGHSTIRILVALGLALGTVFGATSCSGSDEEDAAPTIRQMTETMISGPVAAAAGVGDLSPVCPEVTEPAVGVGWDCTATTSDERILNLRATINDQGQVEVSTTNMITAAALPSFERAAVEALNTTLGSRLADDAVDCGESPVVFGQDRVMVCALRDPHTLEVFDVSLSIDDIEARQFSLVVADQPRT